MQCQSTNRRVYKMQCQWSGSCDCWIISDRLKRDEQGANGNNNISSTAEKKKATVAGDVFRVHTQLYELIFFVVRAGQDCPNHPANQEKMPVPTRITLLKELVQVYLSCINTSGTRPGPGQM
jgi:hypothetical protein